MEVSDNFQVSVRQAQDTTHICCITEQKAVSKLHTTGEGVWGAGFEPSQPLSDPM